MYSATVHDVLPLMLLLTGWQNGLLCFHAELLVVYSKDGIAQFETKMKFQFELTGLPARLHVHISVCGTYQVP
jgi:hypothetical protein